MTEKLSRFADRATYLLGSPWSVVGAFLVIGGWFVLGPVMGFGETWMLLINTLTTIVTFVMVFVIQASTNRQGKALMLKVDELLLHAAPPEADEAIGAEELPEADLDRMEDRVRAARDAGV